MIQVPTTLMGVVDASIGIKTGVNFIGKKNKLGTHLHLSLHAAQSLVSRNVHACTPSLLFRLPASVAKLSKLA